MWDSQKWERTCEYPGRSHGRIQCDIILADTVEIRFTVRSQQEPYYKTGKRT